MFISVLIIIHMCNAAVAQRTYGCSQNNEYANYMSCLNDWRVVREYTRGHSAFLKDVTLLDEICILPGSPTVVEMDKCVIGAVSPLCDGIIAHWTGLKEFVSFLCYHRDAFEGTYARCRANVSFQTAYEECMSTNVKQMNAGEDTCRSYRQMGKCLKNALTNYCSKRATDFFSLAFSVREAPVIANSCKQEKQKIPDYVFDIQNDATSSENIQKNGKHQADNSRNESHMTEAPEENLAVKVSNSSYILCASSALVVFFLFINGEIKHT